MSYAIKIIKGGEEIFRGITDHTAIILKDGSKQYGSHIGWPFLASRLRDEGVFERVAHEFVALNVETNEFEYVENPEESDIHKALNQLSDDYGVIPFMTI